VPQAAALIRADAAYTDLSPTQYGSALDWLLEAGLVVDTNGTRQLAADVQGASDLECRQLLFDRSLLAMSPAWLVDADALISDTDELPQDALQLAALFDLNDNHALLGVRQVSGRVDLAARSRVGAEGEAALVALLEAEWPGATRHVALTDDGFGYDVSVSVDGFSWHLEVKTTVRRGRLVVYLSRHEFNVSRLDPAWRLVIVGLSDEGSIPALATVQAGVVQARVPADQHARGRWESVRLELAPSDLSRGLGFLPANASPTLHGRPDPSRSVFGWLPDVG
jgi:hypothetical protein